MAKKKVKKVAVIAPYLYRIKDKYATLPQHSQWVPCTEEMKSKIESKPDSHKYEFQAPEKGAPTENAIPKQKPTE